MPLTGDGYFAGEYPGGTTTVEGAPVSATVLVYQRDSGQLIAQTESSQSGEWIVTGVDLSKAHDIVGRKEGFNDVIVSNVMPTSMVDITYTGDIANNETFTGALGYLELVGGIPPYAASVVDPLPAGLFPVVDGRQLIIDGTTTDDDVFNSTVRITSSNGATKDVPVKLVVGFKAPANLEAETLEDAGTFSVVLTWEVTNSTQEVLVFRSTTPFDLESMPAPIATLTGDAVSYTDDDVIEDDEFYYMVASVCESYTLYSDEVREVVGGDPHWDNVVALLYFDDPNDPWKDEVGNVWTGTAGTASVVTQGSPFNTACMRFNGDTFLSLDNAYISTDEPLTIESYFRKTPTNRGTGTQLILGMYESNTRRMSYYWTDASSTGDAFRVYQRPAKPDSSMVRVILEKEFLEGSWEHVAYVRDSAGHRLYIGGVLVAVSGQELNGMTGAYHLGSLRGDAEFLHGDVSNLRITKGVARYTEDFTPPTKPFPNK